MKDSVINAYNSIILLILLTFHQAIYSTLIFPPEFSENQSHEKWTVPLLVTALILIAVLVVIAVFVCRRKEYFVYDDFFLYFSF